uniref:G-protein coupled receptors family 1 profile domain-containing protein n=1 Tax=Anopheles farauti TaxID=69004 RepID=A0A182QFK0_9DIPT
MYDDYTSIEDYFSNEVYSTHPSYYEDHLENVSIPAVPLQYSTESVLWYAYNAVIVAVGIVLNLVLIKGIVGAKSGGALLFVLQIAVIDVLSLRTSIWELHYHLDRTWTYPTEYCTLYSGLESFCSVATVYFIIGLNFHSISSYNLAVKLAKNALTTSDTEMAAESLTDENSYEVATDTISQKRSLTIDYRYKRRHISVLFPILLVWFMALSESVPLFLFADIVTVPKPEGHTEQQANMQYCTVLVNTLANHSFVRFMIIGIRIILPTVALLITLIQTVVKFYRGKHFTQPDEIDENVAFALKLSIFLSLSYAIFTFQRLYGSLLQEILPESNATSKYPLFDPIVGLSLANFHYSASMIRPLVVIVMCKQKCNHVDMSFICKTRPPENGVR